MTRVLNIRRTLLAAVDNFIEGSPASVAKAHRLIDRCYTARRVITLDEVVWGGLIMELTDSVYYTSLTALHEYRSLLSRGSAEIHRTYLNFDFGPQFTPWERAWLGTLNDMLDFLDGFPFADGNLALQEYARRVDEIKQAMIQSPPPERLEDEMIYHLILREVSTILINIGLRYSLLRPTHLVPIPPFSSFPPQPVKGRDNMPDISRDLDWARHALRSIVEEGWLLLTWQISPHHFILSLH